MRFLLKPYYWLYWRILDGRETRFVRELERRVRRDGGEQIVYVHLGPREPAALVILEADYFHTLTTPTHLLIGRKGAKKQDAAIEIQPPVPERHGHLEARR